MLSKRLMEKNIRESLCGLGVEEELPKQNFKNIRHKGEKKLNLIEKKGFMNNGDKTDR